jgi:anti-sigma regulatory factor (Ser/Thr protein kinase)
MHQVARFTNSRLASFQSNERFTSELIHEIASPLSSIILMTQCELRTPSPQDLPETLGLILREAQRVRCILEGTRKSARSETSSKSVCNLNDLVRRAVGLAHGYMNYAAHIFELELSDSLPTVAVNETGIEQVLVNLIRNAAEAGDSIDRGVHICVRTLKVSEGVEISITDDGPGIAADQLNNIFTPFFSTKTEDLGLHGLGLSVCRRIMDDHRGQIRVTSVVGGGSVFTLRLEEERDTQAISTIETVTNAPKPAPHPARRTPEEGCRQPIIYKVFHHRISRTTPLSSPNRPTARSSPWRRHSPSPAMATADFRLPSISARLRSRKKIIKSFPCYSRTMDYDLSTRGVLVDESGCSHRTK